MLFQHICFCETSPTFRADVGALPSMHAHVLRYLAGHREPFATDSAFEWPLTCVGEPMGPHSSHLGESFPTVWTDVGLLARVDPHVTSQTSCCGETLGTLRALIWPLSCMGTYMLLQVVPVPKAPPTVGTHLWFLLAVPQLVVCQTFLGNKTLAALVALIGFVVIISLMQLQLADPRESLLTVPALETVVLAVR